MAYQYTPRKKNIYRERKGYIPNWLAPGAWQTRLGNAWFPGAEDFYNRGLVENIEDFKNKYSDPQQKENLLNEVKQQDKTFFERIKEPFSKGAEYVQEAFKEDPKLKEIRESQGSFIKEMLDIARQGIPQQIQNLEQQQQTPYLEQAFGKVGGPVAGALGGTLLGELVNQPGSQFTSNEFQSTNPLSGKLLGSLLGSLAVQGASNYGPQIQQKGQGVLDFLKNLSPQ